LTARVRLVSRARRVHALYASRTPPKEPCMNVRAALRRRAGFKIAAVLAEQRALARGWFR